MTEENKGIYFTELVLQNVRCFGNNAVLKLSNDNGEWSRWNVILGDNGTGKTTLLQCLAGIEQISHIISNYRRQKNIKWNPKSYYNTPFSKLINPAKNTNIDLSIEIKIITEIVNQKSNKKYRITFGEGDIDATNIQINDTIYSSLLILGYGANRRISAQILSEKEFDTENSETLFDDDAKLINTEEWLYQMDYSAAYAENRDTNLKQYAKERRDLVFKIIVDILPDIEEIRTDIEGSPAIPVIKFKTPYGWVRIRELSYGYKTMVAWIVDVAARMFKHYSDSENPLEEPVIILVDEVDLHLHPKWQRQIFDFLEKRFPRAQFIVTAHSPLIVQSAPKEANIIVLKKEKIGNECVVKIDNDIESVRNWRIDQIMSSDIFGLNASRNSEIDVKLSERKKLLQKTNLNEEEKKRIDELNELSYSLPTADNPQDIKAMELIRKAADFLKNKQNGNDTNQK